MPDAAPPSTAVILAAGAGRRLRGTHEAPKGLLEISGSRLVPRSLRLLADSAGVADFVIAVGWRGEDYREELRDLGKAVRFVENRDFASTGSLRSLALAAAEVRGDAWLLESDILYEPRALAALAAARSRNAILASGPTGCGDEVWVFADARGILEKMSKNAVAGRPAVGELVGISRVSSGLLAALAAASAFLPPEAHYEDGFNAVCRAHPTEVVTVADLAWTEIDDAAQLERARRDTWPRILAREATVG